MPYRWLQIAFGVIATRGIEPHEVIQVLSSGHRRIVPAHTPEGIPLRSIWGRTATGRALIVVVRPVEGFDSVIIGARELSATQGEEFEAWENGR
ncbi:MAG: hypothetical protein HKP61_17230 [Dactylosporangium sp.]|nr:hypothetical protein [Dactylosporangium sp.]NNJ62649.1 hypothetical protein [Dactylosporangium sp.]